MRVRSSCGGEGVRWAGELERRGKSDGAPGMPNLKYLTSSTSSICHPLHSTHRRALCFLPPPRYHLLVRVGRCSTHITRKRRPTRTPRRRPRIRHARWRTDADYVTSQRLAPHGGRGGGSDRQSHRACRDPVFLVRPQASSKHSAQAYRPVKRTPNACVRRLLQRRACRRCRWRREGCIMRSAGRRPLFGGARDYCVASAGDRDAGREHAADCTRSEGGSRRANVSLKRVHGHKVKWPGAALPYEATEDILLGRCRHLLEPRTATVNIMPSRHSPHVHSRL